MSKVWFAEKMDGEVITLTEKEALLHFETNNISQRMRLKFLGTSDGTIYNEAKKKVVELLADERQKEMAEYMNLNDVEKKYYDSQLRQKLSKEIKEIIDKGYQDELEQAKKNGVEQPRKSLRITTTVAGQNVGGAKRDEIIGMMKKTI